MDRSVEMVSKEKLEDILHDEEVEARWKSISNSETIRKAEADEKFWKEHLDPFYDEMFPHTPAKAVGDVVRKEIEEYEENDPIFSELDYIEAYTQHIMALMGLVLPILVVIVLILIVLEAN